MTPPFKRTLLLAVALLAFAGVFTNLLSQETPYGRVKGALIASETGRRLPHVEVTLVKKDEPWAKATTDERGEFTFDRVEVGDYTFTAVTRAHEQPKAKVTVAEDKISDVDLSLKPMDPFVNVLQNQQIFTTKEERKFHILGFAPATDLEMRVYRVPKAVAVKRWNSWLTDGLDTGGQDLKTADLDAVPDLEKVSTERLPIHGRDIEGVFREEVHLGTGTPGMYLLALQAGRTRGLFLMTVTDLGLVVKASSSDALVYAVNLFSGAPMPDTSLQLMSGDKPLTQGRAGADGVLALKLPAMGEDESQLQVVGTSGESMAVASVYVGSEGRDPLKVYTYTDRPVYRPGHTVYFKSLVRRLTGDQYSVPASLSAQVKVTDEKSNEIYSGAATTNAYGSLNGSFPLNANAIPGSYTLTLTINGKAYETSFRVAEYRKPEYVVTVKAERERYVQGEPITATVSAQYYFGAPVSNAKVNYYVTRSPSYYYPGVSDWDDDVKSEAEGEGGSENYGGGEASNEGEGTTDANGQLRITLPPMPQENADPALAEGQDWQVSIEATVTDASNRSETDSGDTLVTQGDYRLEASAEDSVAKPGQPVTVTVAASDYDGKPVPGASGEAVLYRVDWLKGREKRTEVGRQPWKADAKGKGTVAVTPDKDGDYRVILASTDRHQHVINASTWMWAMSDEYESFDYPYQDLDVQADKHLYKEGDTAEVIVNTKHAPTTALLTLEGAGILQHRRVQLAGKTNVLKIPITPDLMPAAKLGICFVKEKAMYSGEAVLNVSRERKALKVEVTPDKPTYLPGEKATYRVRTLSPQGKPVAAEVSLGVVDEAIYAIQPETTDPIVRFFYPKRLYEVQTAFSSPQVYLSGDDKAGDTIHTRKDFKDTAYWMPGSVTNANGIATFTVTMPENLTTWRATVRAATLATDVGQTTSTAITQKPFLLRLEAPRFFTQGDEVAVAAIAHNLTRGTLSATVGLDMSGAKSGNTQSVSIKPGESQRVEWRITAGEVGDVPVRVWARAGSLNDAMELTLPVQAKGRESTILRSGTVEGSETVSIDIPRDVVPETQSLTIRLTPSLASAMLGSLDYLASYPYGCAEQTMSAFLPDLMVEELLNKSGVENADLKRRLPPMVEAGLLRLYRYQHEDGGWRWWAYDETDPWMTAYVVFGLNMAKTQGYNVNIDILQRGISALKGMAGTPKKIDPDTQAYMAYVLALVGETDAAQGVVTRFTDAGGAVRPNGMSDWGRSALALALGQLGRAEDGKALLETVWPHFTGGTFAPMTVKRKGEEEVWRSDTEYAAVLLTAAATLTPNDPRLPDLVRGLLERRREDHWYSTRDTAFALHGLSRYLAATKELQPDMMARVIMNGHRVENDRHFTADDVFKPEMQITLAPSDLMSGRKNSIDLTKTGTGKLYYTVTWNGTVKSDLSKPVTNDSGLVIERNYRLMKPGEQPVYDPKASPPTGPGQTEYHGGDIVEVALTLRTDRRVDYVMVEDPLPAGCEVSDRGNVDPYEWTNWWADQVVRDEKVSFAVRHLDPGARTIRYRMFAQIPGTYTALPPRVFDMYNPDLRGEGAGQTVTIR